MDLASDCRLRADDQRKIDLVCDRFEQTLRPDVPPQLEKYLVNVESHLLPHLFRQLFLLELEHRDRLRESPAKQDYQRRFPQFSSIVDQLFAARSRCADSHRESGDTDKTSGVKTDVVLCPANNNHELVDELIGKNVHIHRLEEKLGEGGMGRVYRATHTLLGSQRAVKIIVPSMARREHIVRRFHEEAKAICLLSHPNIVALYDFGEHEGILYLVMELLAGEDLGKRVERLGPLKVWEAVELICQAAEGIAYAHEQRRVHRDIKPRNLFRTADGTCKILDFGLVKALHDASDTSLAKASSIFEISASAELRLTEGDSRLGTPGYMSPEQLLDPRAADERSDIYSLGCTLYYLITGVNAIRGTPGEIRESTLSGIVEPPRSKRRDVPLLLNDFILKLMHVDPDQRPANAREVARTLGQLCRWGTDSHKSVSQSNRWLNWSQRHFLTIMLLFAVVPTLLLTLPNAWFNSSIITPGAEERFKVAMCVINSLGNLIGLTIGIIVASPIVRAVNRVVASTSITEREIRDARLRCLDMGRYALWINLLGWIVAGMCYPVLLKTLGVPLSGWGIWQFLVSLTLYGSVAAVYAYFLVSVVTLRIAYPLLRDQALPTANELAAVERELKLSSFMERAAMMLLMLCILTVIGFRSVNEDASSKSLLALVAFGIIGYPAAVYLARVMRRNLGFVRYIMTGERAEIT